MIATRVSAPLESIEAGDPGRLLTIYPAPSCLRRLAWECIFSSDSLKRQLPSVLLSARYDDESRCDWLREFRHRSGHSVLFVPRTLRVQIRLHYLTPEAERSVAAHALAAELCELFRAASPE